MALPARITKKDAAELLGITAQTLDNRIDAKKYRWPPTSWSELLEQEIERRLHGGVAADSDDARFRRARADNHEIEAAKKRGDVAPISAFEEQIVAIHGGCVQEIDGAEARLLRAAPTVSEAIRREFRAFRENMARGVARYCERLEERASALRTGARATRRRVGSSREGAADRHRGAGPV